jgi:hypothetical protein
MSKGSVSKKEIPTPEKGIRKMRMKKKKNKLPSHQCSFLIFDHV